MTGPRARPRRSVRAPRRGPSDDTGTLAVVQAAWMLVLVLLVGLAVLDVGALLKAGRVASAAADGAALAAATASRNGSPVTPRVAARRVADAHGARLDACDCGGADAHVTVVAPVEARMLVHLGIVEVRAEATATLVRRPDPGP